MRGAFKLFPQKQFGRPKPPEPRLADTLLTVPAGEPGSVAVVGVVAASLIVALSTLHTAARVPLALVHSGPPPSAQRRRRGSFLRQSNPDTPGRPRPRAPGFAAA